MSDIFREVDEALQQEKLANIWKEYGSTIIAALVILVLSTALTTAYRSWDNSRNAAETTRLIQALDSPAPHKAVADVIENTRGGHEALGLLISADMLMEEGKTTEAAALYQQAAENNSAPKDMRDLARILYAQTAPDGNADMLKPILSNKKSPWIWHARIEAAVMAAHQEQDYAKALDYLTPFEDVTTIPLSLKQRGNALSHVYGLKAEQAAPKTSEEKAE